QPSSPIPTWSWSCSTTTSSRGCLTKHPASLARCSRLRRTASAKQTPAPSSSRARSGALGRPLLRRTPDLLRNPLLGCLLRGLHIPCPSSACLHEVLGELGACFGRHGSTLFRDFLGRLLCCRFARGGRRSA